MTSLQNSMQMCPERVVIKVCNLRWVDITCEERGTPYWLEGWRLVWPEWNVDLNKKYIFGSVLNNIEMSHDAETSSLARIAVTFNLFNIYANNDQGMFRGKINKCSGGCLCFGLDWQGGDHSYLAGTWRWKAAVPLVAPGDTADIFRLKVEVMLK